MRSEHVKRSYVLFIVIQDNSKAKQVLKELESIGITGATVMDTMGSASNKTVFSVVKNEEMVILAMDRVETMLEIDHKTNKGIMFTVPLVGEMGLL